MPVRCYIGEMKNLNTYILYKKIKRTSKSIKNKKYTIYVGNLENLI
jgi:hypothetical protein